MAFPSLPLAYFVDRLSPFIWRIHGDIGLRWYGVTYVLGFAAGAWLLSRYAAAGRSLVPAARIPDLMTAVIVGVLVGGRLGSYLLYDGWRSFLSEPLAIFYVWRGGMASHGGMIGVALALVWFARNQRIPFLHLGDIITTAAPPGLFFVRIANFVNGELWGRITTVPWAVIFPNSRPGWPDSMVPPRHPSQIYEACLEGLLLGIYLQIRFWTSDAVRREPGRLSGEFFIGYSIARILGERFREPDASLILGLSRGTFYTFFLAAFGLWLCLRRKQPLELPGA